MLFALGKGRLSSCVVSSEMSLWGSALKAAVVDPHSVVERKQKEKNEKRTKIQRKEPTRSCLCSNFLTRQRCDFRDWRASLFSQCDKGAANWEMYLSFWNRMAEMFILRLVLPQFFGHQGSDTSNSDARQICRCQSHKLPAVSDRTDSLWWMYRNQTKSWKYKEFIKPAEMNWNQREPSERAVSLCKTVQVKCRNWPSRFRFRKIRGSVRLLLSTYWTSHFLFRKKWFAATLAFYFFIICQAEASKARSLKLWPLTQPVPTFRTATFSGLELQTGFVRIRLHSFSKVIPQRKESLVKVHVRQPRLGTQTASPTSCDGAIGSFSCRFCRLTRQLPCQPQHRITGRLHTEFSQKRFQENFAVSTWNSLQATAESQSKVAECKTTQIAKRFNEIAKRFWKKTHEGFLWACKMRVQK